MVWNFALLQTRPYKGKYFTFALTPLKANRVLGIFEVSLGGINGVSVDQRIVFAAAIKADASQMILAHNHPSGSTKPSFQDRQLTKLLVDGGRILNIKIIDHIIVTVDGFYSFADEGDL